MRRLPLAYQCDRRFTEMEGGDTVRRCQDCGCDVVNLSSLDEATARRLLSERTATVCVNFRLNKGNIVFRKTRNVLAAAAAAAILLAATPSQADTSTPRPPTIKEPKHPKPAKKRARKEQDDDRFNGGLLTPVF